MKNTRIYALLIIFLICASFASADTIFFKSGDKVEGIITGENDDQVEIEIYIGESSMSCTYGQDHILKIVRDEKSNQRLKEEYDQAVNGDVSQEPEAEEKSVPRTDSSELIKLVFAIAQISIPLLLIPIVVRRKKSFFGVSWIISSVILAVILLSGILQLYMYYYKKVRYQMHNITVLLEEQERTYEPYPAKEYVPDYSYLEVEPFSVENIYFSIKDSYGAIKGYVIFTDDQGRRCTTYGTLSLSRNRKEYARDSEGYEYVHSDKTTYLESINFTPEDFEYGNGSAWLPFTLSPSMVKNGDIIELEWGQFKKKRTLWMKDLRE